MLTENAHWESMALGSMPFATESQARKIIVTGGKRAWQGR